MSTEVKALVEELSKDFVEFKKANDAGSTDLAEKINKGLSTLEERIAKAETAIARGATIEAVEEIKDVRSFLASGKHKNKDFNEFLRKSTNGAFFETKADIANSTTNGVFPVLDTVIGRVIKDGSPLVGLAHNVSVSSGSPYTKVFNLNDAAAAWVGETGSRAKTDSNTTHKVEIAAHEIYAYPEVTLASLEDAFYDVEGELLWSAGDDLARKVATSLVSGSGDGSSQPTGFMTVTEDATGAALINRLNVVAADDDTTIGFDDLVDLTYALPQVYQSSAAFYVKGSTAAAMRKIQNDVGQYIWEPSTQVGQPARILGYPVYIVPDMPAIAASAKSVLFADLSKYLTIVNRVGVSVQKDTITKPGFAKYYVRARYGAKMVDGRAGVVLKHLAS